MVFLRHYTTLRNEHVYTHVLSAALKTPPEDKPLTNFNSPLLDAELCTDGWRSGVGTLVDTDTSILSGAG